MSDLTANTDWICEYGILSGWGRRRIYCAMHAVEMSPYLQRLSLSDESEETLEDIGDLAEDRYEELFLHISSEPHYREAEASPPAAQHHSSHRNKHVCQHVAVHGFLMVLGHFLGHKHR
ncbi:MAG: hypothetical protein ABJZ03_00105 [Marinomonas sp.]